MHALIVDDSRSMRMLLAKTIKELGFSISEAGNGQEALTRLNDGEPVDLILIDWNMPGMNGLDLVCAIRGNALLNSMRILMVTTETSLAQVGQALSAGANEYLMKPFSKENLLEKLKLIGI